MNGDTRYLIQNGMILDSQAREPYPADLLIEEGKITAIAPKITPKPGWHLWDVEGAYISRGWVDAHTHLTLAPRFPALDVNKIYPCDGLTYVVDAGSCGADNFQLMEKTMQELVIPSKAYLYVSKVGSGFFGDELLSLDLLDPDRFYATYEQYKDRIIGVKIRIDPRVNAFIMDSLHQAREIADRLSLPLIVHPTRCPEPLEEILCVLKKNDVYAHTYSSLAPCILDDDNHVKSCVRQARERGVWFDLAHGSNNFSFQVAKQAIAEDFLVDTISTDLHALNIAAPVRSMADVMTKMLCVGLDLRGIVDRVTTAPAKMLGLGVDKSAVRAGEPADLTIFRVQQGVFSLRDSYGDTMQADRRIEVMATIYGTHCFAARQGIPYIQN